jgi:hypothetical protein
MLFSELFWANALMLVGGVSAMCAGIMYRSKCVKVNLCCGLLAIERDIQHEIENDEHIEMPSTELHIPHSGSGENQNDNLHGIL